MYCSCLIRKVGVVDAISLSSVSYLILLRQPHVQSVHASSERELQTDKKRRTFQGIFFAAH